MRHFLETVGVSRYVLGDRLLASYARGLELILWRPRREGYTIRKCSARATENVFEVEGDFARLEGVLAEKTGLKDFAILRVESIPKHGVAFFFRQVASVH